LVEINNHIRALENRKRALLKKDDDRRKFLIGCYYLQLMNENEILRSRILEDMDSYLVRSKDRSLFHLPPKPKSRNSSRKMNDIPVPGPVSDAMTLRQAEILFIEKVLRDNDGNQQATARALGIARSTLVNKLRKYGLLQDS
jgi:DNA-binding NtrC family response regulator